jgi:hypothetical protein
MSLFDDVMRALEIPDALLDPSFSTCINTFVEELISIIEYDDADQSGEEVEHAVESLTSIATAIFAFIETNSSEVANVLETMIQLHGLLMPLDDEIVASRKFKNVTSRICEKWSRGPLSTRLQ